MMKPYYFIKSSCFFSLKESLWKSARSDAISSLVVVKHAVILLYKLFMSAVSSTCTIFSVGDSGMEVGVVEMST